MQITQSGLTDINKISDTRNVLVIAFYFPPMGLSGVQRTLKFVKYLPEFGWNPIVLTAAAESYYGYDESLMREISQDTKIFRTPGSGKPSRKFPSYFVQKIGRAVLQTIYLPDSKVKWKIPALKLADYIFKLHNIDVIFATSPPYTDLIIGKELAEKYKVPLISDYRDIWVGNPFNFYPTPFHKNFHVENERSVLSKSDKVIVTNRDAKELLIQSYPNSISHDEVAIIEHGYDRTDFENIDYNKDNSKFVITHSGMFQDDRTPLYFIKALELLKDKIKEKFSKVEARFVGLMRKEHIKQIDKSLVKSNCKLIGYVSHKEAVSHLLESDLLWLMLNDTARSPGKLYEYFGANKPILISSPDGAMKTLTLESGAGFASMPKDEKSIFKIILDLFFLWEEGNLPKPKKDFIEKFDRKILTGKLAQVLSYNMR